MTSSQHLLDDLLQTNKEFRQLSDQHRELDERLSELSHQPYRSNTEELEKAILKKRKLQLKDRMQYILRCQKNPAVNSNTVTLQPDAQS